jgi:hypothetical protein
MNKTPTIHLMLISAVLYAAPVTLPAQQSNIETMLRGCASIDDDGQRHSCYDQVLRPDKMTEGNELPGPAENSDKPESVTSPQAQAEVMEDKPAAIDEFGLKEKKPEEVAEVKPAAVDEFGLKQKQPRETVTITVTVKGIRKNLTGRFVYTTTDGQVWVQIDTRRAHYDEVPFVAEIRTAAMDSYFLKPKSYGFSVRVRREK